MTCQVAIHTTATQPRIGLARYVSQDKTANDTV